MRKKSKYLFLVSLCAILSLSGCRRKEAETETETQTVSETETDTESETETEKTTEKSTSKSTSTKSSTTKSSTSSKSTTTSSKSSTSSSTKKTTVKPSTVTSTTKTTESTSSSTESTESSVSATTDYGTEQCPYCYQQISLAPNADGTTEYSVHVAQEKAWADTYGWGDQPATNAGTDGTTASTDTTPQTETTASTDSTSTTNNTNTSDSAQCGYCYQWFSVSDGSYSAHVAQEEASMGVSGGSTTMIVCPLCGNSYTKEMFSYHVCTGSTEN